MLEAGVVLNSNFEPIYWHLPVGRSSVYLPDSRDLWEVFWENRNNLSGFGHSHPNSGPTLPSWEDITTFSALDLALGRKLNYWIISTDQVCLFKHFGPDKYNYKIVEQDEDTNHVWLEQLRKYSY